MARVGRVRTVMRCCSRCESVQDLSNAEFFSPSVRPLHPVVYASAIVLLLCLFTVIVTYTCHHRYRSLGSAVRPLSTSGGDNGFRIRHSRSVRVSRKFWHMLVNLCFHVSLTVAVFTGGINQIRLASVCQAVSELLRLREASLI